MTGFGPIYGKPIKLLTDHQAREPLIKRNRSNKTYSARLTRWLDRLAHFSINVGHMAGKHLTLTDYLSRNPSAPPQADDAYDEEYVINKIVPHYKFVVKYGCLSNHFNQSHDATRISESKHSKTREQTAIACLNRPPESCINSIANSNNLTMDARTIDNLEAADSSAETRQLIARWRDIVKPGIYRQSGGHWKKYHEPKFLRNERKIIEERLQLETDEDKKIRHVEKRKLKYGKEHTERNPKTARRLDCNRCGAPNWSKQHECPAKGKKCAKCGKLGHYAKCCRSGRKINHIADEEAYSADEDEWTPDRIHSIQQKINSLGNGSKNGLPFYTKTLLVNNRAIKFIVDTGSPITLIPKSKFNNITTMKPVTTDYRDVNDNKIKVEGKTTANIRIDGKETTGITGNN